MRRADRGPASSASDTSEPDGGLRAGSLLLDPGRHEAHVGDERLDLTPIEYRLAEALVRAGGDLVPHLRLVRAGWPSEADPDLLWLKPHVARLRRKVESAGGPKILAVRGVGYRLES
jgi:DNA-binding response OmpR family regulator